MKEEKLKQAKELLRAFNKTFGENKQFWYHKIPEDYWLNSVKNAVKFIQEKQDEEVRKENLNQRIRKMLFRN